MPDYYQFDFKCRNCGHEFKYHKLRECPRCGSFGIKLIEEGMKNDRKERN